MRIFNDRMRGGYIQVNRCYHNFSKEFICAKKVAFELIHTIEDCVVMTWFIVYFDAQFSVTVFTQAFEVSVAKIFHWFIRTQQFHY